MISIFPPKNSMLRSKPYGEELWDGFVLNEDLRFLELNVIIEQRVIWIETGDIWYGGMGRERGGGREMDVVYLSGQGGRGSGGKGIWCCDGCTFTFVEIMI